MKRIFIVHIFLAFSFTGLSQSLVGKWKGSFRYNNDPLPYNIQVQLTSTAIDLLITLNTDSSYNILSITYHNKNDVVLTDTCKMKYTKTGNRSIKLEEYECFNQASQDHMQIMFLKFNKRDTLILEGYWKSVLPKGRGSGDIHFDKIE